MNAPAKNAPSQHQANARAIRAPYPDDLRALLSLARAREARTGLSQWDGLHPGATPLRALPRLAQQLGLAAIELKDESVRSPLGSFKALGAPFALVALIQRRWPERHYQAADLLAGRHAAGLADFVVISATDGNHGRGLAAAARSIGCRCVIVLHAHVSPEREAPIAALGAQIVRIAGNYDDSVHEAARLAREHGWQVVSDTSYEGYEDIPRDVMQGYSVIVDELLDLDTDGAPCPWTHVFLQGGVGGLAAGIAAPLWERYGAQRPVMVVVEPEQADCLLQSARLGRPAQATGSVDSVMAGLACGETSPLAWRFLQPAVDHYLTITDAQAVEAMRRLAHGDGGDVPVEGGESGVAGLAGLLAVAGDAAWRERLGLDAGSRVLVINTEGATAPGVYASLAGRTADDVRAAQAQWLQQAAAQAPARLDGRRLMARLEAHAQIGAIDGGGVCRIALTDADRDGRDRLVHWMRALGLQVQVDRIGNLFGTRAGAEDLPPVMTGSHIDTVATGGRYDGIYGVMAALEAVHWLNAHQVRTRRPLVVAAFTNEEGVRYMPDMMGSLVHAGGLPLQQALDTVGTDGTRLGDELARIGYAGTLEVGAIRPHAFVELHIEQGPVLEAEGLALGAVEDLQGISWQEVVVTGQSNHAGTTPMPLRRDAGHAAAAIAVFVRELALRIGGAMVGTVGSIALHPNLINVIAARATLTVDLRHTDEAVLQAAEAELAAFLAALAQREGLDIQARRLARFEPVRFDAGLVGRIEAAAARRGLAHRRMTSGAGHDAQMMARIAPSAMIFVPSRGGISHNPREFTEPQALCAGAEVLLDVLRALADEG